MSGAEWSGTVKAVMEGDEWALDVLGCPFGGPHNGRDVHGEYFSPATNFYPDAFPAPPVVYYHGFDPEGRPSVVPQFIGKTTRQEMRADGVWYRVVLDKAKPFAKRVWDAALEFRARASSGSIAHLKRMLPDGHITHWPVAELSVFDIDDRRTPANNYAVALPAMKAVYEQAGLDLPPLTEVEMGNVPAAQNGAPAAPMIDQATVEGWVGAALKGYFEQQSAAKQAQTQQEQAIQQRIDAAVKAKQDELVADFARSQRLPDGATVPYVAKFAEVRRFDGLEAADVAALISVLDAAQGTRGATAPTDAAYKALAIKLDEDQSRVGEVGRNALKAAGFSTKANEVMQANLTGFGKDWVSVAFSQSIWDRIRLDSFVASNLPSIEVPQGADSIVLPLEGTDPTFYKVAESANTDAMGAPQTTVPSSQIGTDRRTLTVAKMGARVIWSGEMTEDSLIPFVPQLRGQLATAGMEQFEHALIDGDVATAAATNINHAGAGGTPGANDLYTIFDGFRKLALVTNAANSRNVNAALSLADFLNTVKLVGAGGINGLDRSRVGFVVDPLTYYAAMALSQVQTRDVFSTPTVEGGQLTGLYGYKLKPSGFIAAKSGNGLTNATGRVDQTTPANNTRGQILAIRWDQWLLGYKRRMTTEVTRIPRADANEIVCLMRVGLRNRDLEASALSYNITI